MEHVNEATLLQGTKVQLTALRADDAETIARWYQDIEYLRLQDTNIAHPRNASTITTYLKEWNEASDTVAFGIRTVDKGALIGTTGLYEIEWANGVGWLGIGIGERAYWGKGYGSEALTLLLQYAFRELNFHRVQLTVVDYNKRAIAVYEKLGFKHEGVFREFGQRDGERYDMHLYGLLRSEWQIHLNSQA